MVIAAGLVWGMHGAAATGNQGEDICRYCGHEPQFTTSQSVPRGLAAGGGVDAGEIGAADAIDITHLQRPVATEAVLFVDCQLHKLPDAQAVQGRCWCGMGCTRYVVGRGDSSESEFRGTVSCTTEHDLDELQCHAAGFTLGEFIVRLMLFNTPAMGALVSFEALPKQWLKRRGSIEDQSWWGFYCMTNSAEGGGRNGEYIATYASPRIQLHLGYRILLAVCL